MYKMNNYQRYYKKYNDNRRIWAIEYLGGKCTVCHSTENLEFDHIEPSKMSFRIAPNLTMIKSKLIIELKKCQLLCHKHHCDKTRSDMGWHVPVHGVIAMYSNNGCRCKKCKTAWAKYYRLRRINKSGLIKT